MVDDFRRRDVLGLLLGAGLSGLAGIPRANAQQKPRYATLANIIKHVCGFAKNGQDIAISLPDENHNETDLRDPLNSREVVRALKEGNVGDVYIEVPHYMQEWSDNLAAGKTNKSLFLNAFLAEREKWLAHVGLNDKSKPGRGESDQIYLSFMSKIADFVQMTGNEGIRVHFSNFRDPYREIELEKNYHSATTPAEKSLADEAVLQSVYENDAKCAAYIERTRTKGRNIAIHFGRWHLMLTGKDPKTGQDVINIDDLLKKKGMAIAHVTIQKGDPATYHDRVMGKTYDQGVAGKTIEPSDFVYDMNTDTAFRTSSKYPGLEGVPTLRSHPKPQTAKGLAP